MLIENCVVYHGKGAIFCIKGHVVQRSLLLYFAVALWLSKG